MFQRTSYLKGLNTLRFFAAFFVIFAHGHRSLLLLNAIPASDLKVFDRGGSAVELFFTLSGFLITYLLLLELEKTKTVDIRFFYIRRVLRIWPLYFLCLAGGIFVLKVLIPRTTHQSPFYFPLWPFLLFIPNFAATYYKVGLLFPLWSIGIEEQFYLFWAPLVRMFRKNLLPLLLIGGVLTTTFYWIVAFALHSRLDANLIEFLLSIKFHNMLIGALFAYIVMFQIDRYRRSFLSHPVVQILLLLIVLYHYLVAIYPVPEVVVSTLMSFIYGCVFVNLSSIPRSITDLEYQPFIYFGEISFGLYIYHMFVDYTLRLAFQHIHHHINPVATAVIYLSLLLSITIGVAAFSHRYYEAFFLNLRRYYRSAPMIKPDPLNAANEPAGEPTTGSI